MDDKQNGTQSTVDFLASLKPTPSAEKEDFLKMLKPDPVDAKGLIVISPDKMRAFINITMPLHGGNALSAEEIRYLVADSKVNYGLRELTLTRLAQSPLYDRDILIAEGTHPQKGKDGSIIYHIRLSKHAQPFERDDGSVDYKDLGLIENVEREQLLVTKIPPEPGIDGRNVYGDVIVAQMGKEIPLPVGKNTYISDDGLGLHALINGQSDFADRKVQVLESYVVNGDVSVATGNITFIGNVQINGNVLAGFTVQAGGNVDVIGCVEGSRVMAGGNILIRDGFHGMFHGELIAGGNVRCKYIQSGRVQAGGCVEAQAVVSANIQCSDSVRLVGSRSTIMGGRVVAKNIIDAQFIGGKNNPLPTIIEVGSDPTLIIRSQEIQRETTAAIKSIADVDRIIILLKQLESQNRLTPDKEEMLLRSVHTRRINAEKVKSLKQEEEEVRLKLAEEGYGTVYARSYLYPGVRVIIGPEQQIISSPIPAVMLVRSEEGLSNQPAT